MYSFKVQGNSGIYDVVIGKEGNLLIATCTCMNAQKGRICRHRRSIIYGDDSNVLENKILVKEIKEYVANTNKMLVPVELKKTIIVSSIKAEKVKNDKLFFYEREDDNSSWIRMAKLSFDYAIKENKDYALEIKYGQSNSVILMRYVKDSELIWSRYNIKSIPKQIIEEEPTKTINTLKVTISKNGNPYFYERAGEGGYWSRIDKSFFEHLVSDNKDYALETKYDETGTIIYLRYEFDSARGWEKYGVKPIWENSINKTGNHSINLRFKSIQIKKTKGCLSLFIGIAVLILYVVLAISQ